jgi:hypothetical protein
MAAAASSRRCFDPVFEKMNPTDKTTPKKGSTTSPATATPGQPSPANPAHQGIAGTHNLAVLSKNPGRRRRFSFSLPAALFAALQDHAWRANLSVTQFMVDGLERLIAKRRSPQMPPAAELVYGDMSRVLQCIAALHLRLDALCAQLGDMSPKQSMADIAARITVDGVFADIVAELAATRRQLALHLSYLPRPRSARPRITTKDSLPPNRQ